MKATFYLLVLFLNINFCYSQTTVYYTESDNLFANPERGLHKYSITNSDYNIIESYSNLNSTTLSDWRQGDDKITLLYRSFLLNDFLDSDITQTYLENMQLDFDIIRESGLKCIIRFSYSDALSDHAQQPEKNQIISHIAQLAPLLEENKDIILTFQAGFIGTWGEWYYTNSEEFGTNGSIDAVQWENRKDIINAMLNACPENIPLQVRYPAIKINMFGDTLLNNETAYTNTARARIGFFNDAFLNIWGDMGTYGVSSQDQNPVGNNHYIYLANETKYTPMTGETNGINPPRTDGDNAVFEMDSTNWTSLNRDYYTQNFDNWIISGHYDEILRNMGYRLVLKQADFSNIDNLLNVEISIKNKGYARLFKPRNAVLIMKNTSTEEKHSFVFDSDPRTWEGLVNISGTFDILNISDGEYQLFLALPDADPILALRPEYSIRFANIDVWDYDLGYNKLNYSINVSSWVNLPENIKRKDSESKLSLYPNPASNYFQIFADDSSTFNVQIFNLFGKELLYFTNINSEDKINLEYINSGLYFYNIYDNRGNVYAGKLIKQ